MKNIDNEHNCNTRNRKSKPDKQYQKYRGLLLT